MQVIDRWRPNLERVESVSVDGGYTGQQFAGDVKERLEAACRRAIVMNAASYRSIKSILENALDREPLEPVEIPAAHAEVHPNVRGSAYYRKEEEVA